MLWTAACPNWIPHSFDQQDLLKDSCAGSNWQYKVPSQAVRRNLRRFADDFMFQLSSEELEKLEVTFCDLQFCCQDGPAAQTLRLHGARRGKERRQLVLFRGSPTNSA